MRPLLPTIVLLLLIPSSRGQDNDSVTTALARSAFASSTQKPDSGLAMANRAIRMYQQSGNKTTGGLAYKARGWAYMHLGNFDSAFTNLRRAAAIFSAAHDTTELMFVYLNLAHAYSSNSQFSKSISYVLQADTLADLCGNLKAKAGIKNQMAILFRTQQQYPKAIRYFKEAIGNYHLINDTINYLNAIGSLSILYNTISLPDSSLAELDNCLPILKVLQGYDYEKAMTHERLGDTWLGLHRYDRSLDDYRQAFDIFRHSGHKADQAFEAMNLGRVLTELGRRKEAEYYLLQSYQINDSLRLTNYSYDAAAELAELYSAGKDWQNAYQWLATTRRLQDTLSQHEQNEKTVEMQTRYEAEKKDKEIALLKKNQELRAADLQKERAIKASAFILSGLVIVIGLLFLNRYRLIQKNRRLEEIEKLRNTIARDLHDDIGSALSSIHINSNMALSHPDEQLVVKGQLEKIQKNAGRMMESMGDIVWAMNPANDSMDHLQTKMKEFLAEILEPLNISYHLAGMETLKKVKFDIGKRKEIYLIFKEAVNNAAKYSGCTEVTVSLLEDKREARLQVTDNGQGFALPDIRQGNGLRNMQQRAALIGGSLDMITAPGEGTTITLHMPVT